MTTSEVDFLRKNNHMIYKNYPKTPLKFYDRKIIKLAFNNVIGPTNLVLITFNILIFLLVIIFWFWFIGTQQLYTILDNKTEEILNITGQDVVMTGSINLFVDSVLNDSVKIEETKKSIIDRNNDNVDSFHVVILPIIITFLILFLISVMYLIYNIKYPSGYKIFEKYDFILIFITLIMFLSEVIFYFIVITDFHYMSTITLMAKLFNNTV